jgi:hypothetical protein
VQQLARQHPVAYRMFFVALNRQATPLAGNCVSLYLMISPHGETGSPVTLI